MSYRWSTFHFQLVRWILVRVQVDCEVFLNQSRRRRYRRCWMFHIQDIRVEKSWIAHFHLFLRKQTTFLVEKRMYMSWSRRRLCLCRLPKSNEISHQRHNRPDIQREDFFISRTHAWVKTDLCYTTRGFFYLKNSHRSRNRPVIQRADLFFIPRTHTWVKTDLLNSENNLFKISRT